MRLTLVLHLSLQPIFCLYTDNPDYYLAKELYEKLCVPLSVSANKLPQQAEDLQLKPEVLSYCNTIEISKGRGNDLHSDRRFIRNELSNLQKHEIKRYMISAVTVFYPCSLLENNMVLVDVPGW